MAATDPNPPVTDTGPDFEGLVWAYRVFDSGAAEILQGPVLREALERKDGWLWLNFDLSDARAPLEIAALPHLPREAVDMLLTPSDRQHVEIFGDVIAGVVADFEQEARPDLRRVVHWQFVMAAHLFVSARHQPGHTLHQVHLDLQHGRAFPGPLHLFTALIHEFTSATSMLLHELARQLDALEEQLIDRPDASAPEILGHVRASLVRLHRQAIPLRAVLVHMATRRPAWFTDAAAADCRRVAERMDSLAEDLSALRERARALTDELNGLEAIKTNTRLTVLSVLSAVLLPPTFITGLFGMGVPGLPFHNDPLGFAYACALMVGSVIAVLTVLRLQRLL